MTSLPAVRLVTSNPSYPSNVSAPGRARAPAIPPRTPAKPRRGADDETRLRSLLAEGRGALGTSAVDIHFNSLDCRTLDKQGIYVMDEFIIDTRGSALLIEQLDNERVLTGVGGLHIDCRILFRRAYGKMICRLGVDRITADTYIGLIESRSLKEVQSFSFSRPRHVGHDGGGSLWTHLEYRSSPLNEIQGITWRGGSLRLASITLTP